MSQKYTNQIERRVLKDAALFPYIASYIIHDTREGSTIVVGDSDVRSVGESLGMKGEVFKPDL